MEKFNSGRRSQIDNNPSGRLSEPKVSLNGALKSSNNSHGPKKVSFNQESNEQVFPKYESQTIFKKGLKRGMHRNKNYKEYTLPTMTQKYSLDDIADHRVYNMPYEQ